MYTTVLDIQDQSQIVLCIGLYIYLLFEKLQSPSNLRKVAGKFPLKNEKPKVSKYLDMPKKGCSLKASLTV